MSGDTATNHGTLSSSDIRQILELVARFRSDWEAGLSPRIEDTLEANPELDRRVLLRELLALEFLCLSRTGQAVVLEDYRHRFPNDAETLALVGEEAGFGSAGSPSQDEPTIDSPAKQDAATAPFSITRARSGEPGSAEVLPRWIGRYQVETILGEGGYGRVYRALDGDLGRRVAIKVPHHRRVARLADAEAYLAEAQIVAGLDHPGIVPVYDLGRTSDGLCYIVSKLIEGGDLSKKIRLDRPSSRDAAALLAEIADAADHAHRHGLVHRDIKPRNILLDLRGRPYLADFGAALREQDFGKGSGFAGTPYYMSPEQARGEGHRVNPRSDLFSLGVVLYELLTGTRPFKGSTWRETIELIKETEPRPLRDFAPSLSPELERICWKLLSKRATDRHESAAELAEDLRQFLSRSSEPETRIVGDQALVPRGLRSFEAEDAASFLQLLPGPRDRNGVPSSIRFWLDRIADPDPREEPVRVGLVFGPSGSGKSSLIKAGLIPRLPRRVIALHLEASPEGTENRLAAAIRRRWPELPAELPLAQLIGKIRGGEGPFEGQRLLIVLDQFEQFLQGRDQSRLSELADALRQIDGLRVICLVIVRDDFWMSVSRFFQILEISIVEGRNGSAVDLFALKHARQVLEDFGRAYRALPLRPTDLSSDQSAFLDGAVGGLADDGKVIPVQLSLFAEMVKEKPWNPSTLRVIGGAKGVGVEFLEETFGAATGSPARRSQQKAARSVLEALLPDPGANLKGATRLRSDLLEASGHAQEPERFEELERILDQELRLITPVDHSETETEPGERSYQLTHDYLVPSLREWLSRKLRETWRGRVRHRLTERSALWSVRPERKQLPSIAEWLSIQLLTRRAQWDRRESSMMRAADLHHAGRTLYGLLVIALALILGDSVYRFYRSKSLVDQLRMVEPTGISGIIDSMTPYRAWVNPRLHDMLTESLPGSRESLRARFALLRVEPDQARPLAEQLLEADAEDVRVIVPAIGPESPAATDFCWKILQDSEARPGRRLRAACLIASHDPDDRRWSSVASDLVDAVTTEDFFSVVHWSALLHPIRERLLVPLRSTFLLRKDDPKGDIAALMIAEYAADRPDLIAQLILNSDARQLGSLTAKLRAGNPSTIGPISRAIQETLRRDQIDLAAVRAPRIEVKRDQFAARRAVGELALLAFQQPGSVWASLRSLEDNRVRTYLILWIARFGIPPGDLIRHLAVEPDGSVRQAILLALGGYREDSLPDLRRRKLLPELIQIFREDPDPGVHLAIDWLMNRWGLVDQLRPVLEEIRNETDRSHPKRWLLDVQRDTMVVIPRGLTFTMGSPADEQYREPTREVSHRRKIDRSFAIGAKEVTVRQFLRFFEGHDYNKDHAPELDCPINRVSWYEGARYCRRLSELEGFTEDQMCYPRVEEIKPGMRMYPNYLDRPGYRYPTEAEWEASARAGTTTPRFYGYDLSLEVFGAHAWNFYGSESKTHRVGQTIPNPLGLFDVLGNVYERCHDLNVNYPEAVESVVLDESIPGEIIEKDVSRIIRGGAFHRNMDAIRSANRHSTVAGDSTDRVGFRVARTIP